MKFDLSYLEELNEIISSNDYFMKKKRSIPKAKKSPGYTYQFYNQLCACIVRIRETVHYLEKFEFRKENDCGQAFDFYEFINCVAIIKGCAEVLFGIFDKKITDYYPQDKAFRISNKSNKRDIPFFNFIRSASSMHPAETTAHNKITKHKFEVYPYAIWTIPGLSLFKKDRTKESDIELLSWDCKTKGNYKYYYLVTSEFYTFVSNVLKAISELVSVANSIADEYKEKIRCKRLKSPADFENVSDYCLYLRRRIHNKLTDEEFPDGGLLLASHLLSNNLISTNFKNYVKKRVRLIVNKMMRDITTIEYDEIFDGLCLNKILSGPDYHYVSEKYHDYLYNETLCEIENNNFVEFKTFIRYEQNNCNYSNSEWAVIKLLSCNDGRINEAVIKANSYCDLYELVLEIIYKELNRNE